MRRRVEKTWRPDGTEGEVVRLIPENAADVEEIRRLERAGLADTDEGAADHEAAKERQRPSRSSSESRA